VAVPHHLRLHPKRARHHRRLDVMNQRVGGWWWWCALRMRSAWHPPRSVPLCPHGDARRGGRISTAWFRLPPALSWMRRSAHWPAECVMLAARGPALATELRQCVGDMRTPSSRRGSTTLGRPMPRGMTRRTERCGAAGEAPDVGVGEGASVTGSRRCPAVAVSMGLAGFEWTLVFAAVVRRFQPLFFA
jgi:hypothetical protein